MNSRTRFAWVVGLVLMVGAWAECAAPPTAQVAIRQPDDSAGAIAQSLDDVVEPGTRFEPVMTGANLMEGPLHLPDGRWIVSEIAADTVWAFDASGDKTTFLKPANNANGHALDAQGRIIQAEHATAAIARIATDGTRTVLAEKVEGKRFNSPNDVVVKRDGTLWFTDPTYGLGHRTSELGYTGVFRLDPATGKVTVLTRALNQPNGIAFSRDEHTLYISASGRITAFGVNADGTLDAGVNFGPGNDGLKVDALGNVWSTGGKGVDVIRADGKLLGTLPLPEDSTNIAFGGPDGKTVFVTTFKGVYRLTAKVKG